MPGAGAAGSTDGPAALSSSTRAPMPAAYCHFRQASAAQPERKPANDRRALGFVIRAGDARRQRNATLPPAPDAPHIAPEGSMELIRSGRARDLRVDFFRGLALWWIYTDHIPGDVLGDYSLRNFAMCDATEVFVLLAGFGAGMAYGSEMDRQGYLYAGGRCAAPRLDALYRPHLPVRCLHRAGRLFGHRARPQFLPGRDPPRRPGRSAVSRTARGAAAALPAQPAEHTAALRCAAADLRTGLPLLRQPALLLALSISVYAAVRDHRHQSAGLDRRGLVLQSAGLAAPVHDRRHPGLCATAPAAAALANRRAGGARAGWRG